MLDKLAVLIELAVSPLNWFSFSKVGFRLVHTLSHQCNLGGLALRIPYRPSRGH
ncbi:hypothetical protein ACVMIX_003255 [Rhizobium leguminosarum]